jgi:hypothetical protein
MAEQEVVKHTRKILDHLVNNEHSLGHKATELIIEIAIIVFAVSISIWLHGIGENWHEQQQVQSFLSGLKNDVRTDTELMNKKMEEAQVAVGQYAYLASLDPAAPIDNEKFDAAFEAINTPIFAFMPHKGRYEGFKSSGKLTNIENEKLLEQITELVEFNLAGIRQEETYWETVSHANLKAFVDAATYGASREDRYRLITSPKGKHLCAAMAASPLADYRATLALMQKIIQGIDSAYPTAPSNS